MILICIQILVRYAVSNLKLDFLLSMFVFLVRTDLARFAGRIFQGQTHMISIAVLKNAERFGYLVLSIKLKPELKGKQLY